MPDAVKSDATDKKQLREMCTMRGIEYHHAHREKKLREMIDEYDTRNAPPEPVKVDVDSGTGFSSDKPQTPDWEAPTEDERFQKLRADFGRAKAELKPVMEELDRKAAARPPAAEVATPPQREIPANVADALKWFGAYSIGRANLISKYIDTLL